MTNFDFGNSQGPKMSSSQLQHQNFSSGGAPALNKAQLHELQKAHFELGKHPPVGQSQTTTTYTHKVGGRGQQTVSTAELQSSHIRLGTSQSGAHFQTTYN